MVSAEWLAIANPQEEEGYDHRVEFSTLPIKAGRQKLCLQIARERALAHGKFGLLVDLGAPTCMCAPVTVSWLTLRSCMGSYVVIKEVKVQLSM